MAARSEAQRRANVRTGWALAALAGVFALGFVARIMLFGG